MLVVPTGGGVEAGGHELRGGERVVIVVGGSGSGGSFRQARRQAFFGKGKRASVLSQAPGAFGADRGGEEEEYRQGGDGGCGARGRAPGAWGKDTGVHAYCRGFGLVLVVEVTRTSHGLRWRYSNTRDLEVRALVQLDNCLLRFDGGNPIDIDKL